MDSTIVIIILTNEVIANTSRPNNLKSSTLNFLSLFRSIVIIFTTLTIFLLNIGASTYWATGVNNPFKSLIVSLSFLIYSSSLFLSSSIILVINKKNDL